MKAGDLHIDWKEFLAVHSPFLSLSCAYEVLLVPFARALPLPYNGLTFSPRVPHG